nr:unnamed protein product [Digitaria exilis]
MMAAAERLLLCGVGKHREGHDADVRPGGGKRPHLAEHGGMSWPWLRDGMAACHGGGSLLRSGEVVVAHGRAAR